MVHQLKTQRTTLEVNLDAIKTNLAYFRSKLAQGTKLMVVLKASCYGTGDFELATMLQREDVDYFAVSCIEEGVSFRKHGVTLPIMVSNPEVDGFRRLLSYNLEPVVYSLSILRKLVDFAMRQKKTVSIHIKLESGIIRHGIEESDLDAAINVFLKECPYIKIKSIYSNLVNQNDVPVYEGNYTNIQTKKFDRMVRRIEEELKIIAIKHICSTDSILRFPQHHYDMVRLGSGLLGLTKDKKAAKDLQEAMSLKTVISQIRTVSEGSPLGYDERNTIAPRDMDVAIIEIGYGDGLTRCLGNGVGKVLINGQKTEIVGNIEMDMSMINVTGMTFRVGDEVTIFGKGLSINSLAISADTIPQEILSNISRRVKRVFCSLYHI